MLRRLGHSTFRASPQYNLISKTTGWSFRCYFLGEKNNPNQQTQFYFLTINSKYSSFISNLPIPQVKSVEVETVGSTEQNTHLNSSDLDVQILLECDDEASEVQNSTTCEAK